MTEYVKVEEGVQRSPSSFANGDEQETFGTSGARYVGNFHKTRVCGR